MNGTRDYWLETLDKLVYPVLSALAAQKLVETIPVVEKGTSEEMRRRAALEAFCRSLAGMSSWLELDVLSGSEEEMRRRYAGIARSCLSSIVEHGSHDRIALNGARQNLVEAAFLSHALIRAPNSLWHELGARQRVLLVEFLQSSRALIPYNNNWLLFSAMVETALIQLTGEGDILRIDLAVRRVLEWYAGDGVYGDGPEFQWDYYNSFVIQPMLVDIVDALCTAESVPGDVREYYFGKRLIVLKRAQRYAGILERMIGADGSYPPIGRSLAYRCGAFQLLGQMALRREYPKGVQPAQVRCAMTAVIRRTLDAPGTYDPDGWLRVGLSGSQPGLGEHYITTGSAYLAATAFLPLGLDGDDPFWYDDDALWTSARIWTGTDTVCDEAHREI